MGIGVAISTQLQRTECPPANEALFQFFLQRSGLFSDVTINKRNGILDCSSRGSRAMLRNSMLLLYHPSRPDSTVFLHQLRKGPSKELRLETHFGWIAKARGFRNYFASKLFRLAYILRLQGMAPKWFTVSVKYAEQSQANPWTPTGSKNVLSAVLLRYGNFATGPLKHLTRTANWTVYAEAQKNFRVNPKLEVLDAKIATEP